MRRKGYGPDRDRVGRNVGEDILGRALRKVLKPAHRRLLLDYLHGAPPEQMAAQLGITHDSLQRLVSRLLARLRDSEYGDQLREELHSRFGPRHSPVVWEAAKDVPVHRCERPGCIAPPFTQKPTGRPRRYCSPACKQAVYRNARRAGARPDALLSSASRRPLLRRAYRLVSYSDAPPEFPAPRHTPPGFDAYMAYLEQRLAQWGAPAVRTPLTFQANPNRRFISEGWPKISGMWGPPGTGKTQVITHIIHELLEGRHRILLVSPTLVQVLGRHLRRGIEPSLLPAPTPLPLDPSLTSPLHTHIPTYACHTNLPRGHRVLPLPPAILHRFPSWRRDEAPHSGPLRRPGREFGRLRMAPGSAVRAANRRRHRRR